MRNVIRSVSTVVLLAMSALAKAGDLTALSLEELMDIEVISTPQFAGRVADLPASVSILTASDFRTYGWRTLADALRSLGGFNVTYDRAYSYVGVRGLSPPGDYKPRLSILIDGISATENIYDSVLIGGEFPLDIDLIERIEVVRGPGASVVGGDAMGGVVNIITRNGASMHGIEVAATAGSGEAVGGRISTGGLRSNGLEYLISVSGYGAQGTPLKFPEMEPLGSGTIADNDGERRRQLFAKLGYDAWYATLIYGERRKDIPTATYGTVFNDPAYEVIDTEQLIEVGRLDQLGTNTTFSTRVFTGRYGYDAIYPYQGEDFYYHNLDRSRGKWWGTEARLQSRAWEGHQLMAGIEFVDNYQLDLLNEDVGYGCVGYSEEPCVMSRTSGTKGSIYGQDEILLTATTRLTLGLRVERTISDKWRSSPRLGLVQHTETAGTFKLLYATAYREPGASESYYAQWEVAPSASQLRGELLQSMEGIWEYAFDERTQLTTVLYRYQVKDMVVPDEFGGYQNLNATTVGRGAEFELNRNWAGGAALRVSYSLQFPELFGERLSNAPQHLMKLNLALPIPSTSLTTGVEVQASSKRRTEAGTSLGGYGVANLNLVYAPRQQPWLVAVGMYNLFDHHYKDPVALDSYMDPSIFRDGVEQDGRTWRVKLGCRF